MLTCFQHPENNASWFQSIHPGDVDRVAAAHHIALTVAKEFDETFRLYHLEKQEWRWMRAIFNSHGCGWSIYTIQWHDCGCHRYQTGGRDPAKRLRRVRGTS